MVTSAELNDFTMYVTDLASDLPDNINPFHYHVQFKIGDDGFVKQGRATCQSIPCELCTFQVHCEDGVYLTRSLTAAAMDLFPEFQI